MQGQSQLNKECELFLVWSPPQTEGTLQVPCNPKPASTSWTPALNTNVPLVSDSENDRASSSPGHVHISEPTWPVDAEPTVVLQEHTLQRGALVSSHGLRIARIALSRFRECGLFFQNFTKRSVYVSQLTLELNLLHSWLDLAIAVCIPSFHRVVYRCKQAISF